MRNREEDEILVRRAGFTIIELLTTIAVVAILASLLLPAMVTAQRRSNATQCLSKVRQIHLGWQLYAEESQGRLVPNVDGLLGGFTNWVAGNMVDPTDVEDRALLVDTKRSLLAPYLKSADLFKCPSEGSKHVRSYSLNCRMNPVRLNGNMPRWVGGFGAEYAVFRSVTDVSSPSSTFTILDESESSINDGSFAVDMSDTGNPDGQGPRSPAFLIDIPGARHIGAGVVAFADGHAVLHKWSDPLSLRRAKPRDHVAGSNRDVLWLKDNCTTRIK